MCTPPWTAFKAFEPHLKAALIRALFMPYWEYFGPRLAAHNPGAFHACN